MSLRAFFNDIRAFHEKFDLAYNGDLRALAPDLADFRMRCSIEESEEIFGANESILSATIYEELRVARAELLDGFVDQLYFTIGTFYLHGFKPDQFNEAWKRVHAKNMMKIKAQPDGSDSKRGHGSDVIKPEGWTAPDLTDLV